MRKNKCHVSNLNEKRKDYMLPIIADADMEWRYYLDETYKMLMKEEQQQFI